MQVMQPVHCRKKKTCLLVLFVFQGFGDLLGNMLQFDCQCK